MATIRTMILLFASVAAAAFAATDVSLSGTVKDADGAAVSAACVSLASDSTLSDSTDEKGEFSLKTISAIYKNGADAATKRTPACISIRGNRLRFTIGVTSESGLITVYSGNGKRCAALPTGKLTPGTHTLTLPVLASGYYIMNITIDRVTTTYKLVQTGNGIFVSNGREQGTASSAAYTTAAAATADTLIVSKEGFTTAKYPVTSYSQSGIAITLEKESSGPVYAYSAAVENTCADCMVPELSDGKTLTVKNAKLPDPFKKLDGTRISKKSEWRCRRQEILKMAMKYIYGEKPEPPDSVSGTVTTTMITVHVEDQGKKIDFSADIKLPSTGQAPYPAIINLYDPIFGKSMTIGESRVTNEGVAVIYYDYNKIGKEGAVNGSRGKPNPGLFYDIYGGMHSAGLLMAWSWGVSRMIDVLQKSGGAIIDYRRLGTTGCSRAAKGAFAIGLFDERIAVVLSEETSVAGVPAYRVADNLPCPENTSNNYPGLNWLSDNYGPFVQPNTNLLPLDAHELVATFAPRGIYIMENPSATQMCAPGGHMSAVGALEVFKALGCPQNLSYNSNTPNGTIHCSYTNNFTDMLIKNIHKFLLHQPAETGGIVKGSGTLKEKDWIDWTAPTLEDDTDLYETE